MEDSIQACDYFPLQERGGAELSSDSLKNLSSFLTLQKAEEAGFKPEDYSLSPDQATTIAGVFSKYDTNNDMVLSTTEVNQLL